LTPTLQKVSKPGMPSGNLSRSSTSIRIRQVKNSYAQLPTCNCTNPERAKNSRL
jgi:hypothetical protein